MWIAMQRESGSMATKLPVSAGRPTGDCGTPVGGQRGRCAPGQTAPCVAVYQCIAGGAGDDAAALAVVRKDGEPEGLGHEEEGIASVALQARRPVLGRGGKGALRIRAETQSRGGFPIARLPPLQPHAPTGSRRACRCAMLPYRLTSVTGWRPSAVA